MKLNIENFATSLTIYMGMITTFIFGYYFKRVETEFFFDQYLMFAIPIMLIIAMYVSIERGDKK